MSPGPDPDLDALIGDIRREAARRRAEPDFPLEAEARLAADMDRQGPSGGHADLAELAAAASASGSDLGPVTAMAIRELAARLASLERRLVRLHPPAGAPLDPDPADASAGPSLDQWAPMVLSAAAADPGRVLVAGPGAGSWVDRLAAAGFDAYGLDPALPEHGDAAAVRSGGLAAHLDTVGDDALSLAVLVGPLGVEELPGLEALAGSLAGRARSAVVVSESEWWWRRRHGDAGADLSARRPASADTWLAVLDRAGYRCAARFGTGGRDFCAVATRLEGRELPAP